MNRDKISIKDRLSILYPGRQEEVYTEIEKLLEKWSKVQFPSYGKPDNSDIMMITYADAFYMEGEAPLASLKSFLNRYLKDTVSAVHLLPMFPFTSDDGFSVTDFREINPEFGEWEDIEALNRDYDLMFDAVINHVSKSSGYFQRFLQGEKPYDHFFIVADKEKDYSMVTRPRALPLLTAFRTKEGLKWVWTTFSDDQIDLNYKEPAVLLEILDVLLMYASKGARFIRFDAVGFCWKEDNTTCMHLPQTHELIKLIREVLHECVEGCQIITETNVPHRDNISYFGDGHDEASMVYQFPLPPLTLYSFMSGRADKLTEWAKSLEPVTGDTAYFNFLASHDGIGMRPVEDILTQEERQLMVDGVLSRGGQVSTRTMPDGSEVPYELNINYLDAIAGDEGDTELCVQKFMASQCILLSVMGMPGIYYHSLIGSRNSYTDYETSGIKRRINREKMNLPELEKELADEKTLRRKVFESYSRMLKLRKRCAALSPYSPQEVLKLEGRAFTILRGEGPERLLICINVSREEYRVSVPFHGKDLFTGDNILEEVPLGPYQYRWIQITRGENGR